MKNDVLERFLNLNRNLERVVVHLKHLESADGFGKKSFEKFRLEAERLLAGINRYVGEHIRDEADEECKRLDPIVYPQKPEEDKQE